MELIKKYKEMSNRKEKYNIVLKIAEWDNAMADLICRDFTINSERGE